MKTGQQSNSEQHQVLRCSGILTESKTKNNQLGKAVAGTKMKRRGKKSYEPDFLTTAKFPGFHFQLTKISRRRRKLKAKVTTKSLPRSANSVRVVTQSNHIYQNWRHENKTEAARYVKSEGSFIISLNEVKWNTPDWLYFVGQRKTVSFKTAWRVCITVTNNLVFIVLFIRLGLTFCEFQVSLLTSYGKFGPQAAASNSEGKIPGECVWFCPMAHIFVQSLYSHKYFVAI